MPVPPASLASDDLVSRLADPRLLHSEGYIAGWRTAAKDFAVTEPATGQEGARVAQMDANAARNAVVATPR